MPVPKPVVWSVVVDDGAHSQVRTEFGYAGGLYDFSRREFRGFRTVKALPGGQEPGAPTAQRTYTFFQDDARAGRMSSLPAHGRW